MENKNLPVGQEPENEPRTCQGSCGSQAVAVVTEPVSQEIGYFTPAIQEATKVANEITKIFSDKRLYVPIQGRNYVLVEGWQVAGAFFGLTAKIKDVKKIEGGYKATAQIFNSEGKLLGENIAISMAGEKGKSGFDEYAILSMAQTRAIGKAYRTLLGWVVKLAGFEGTPAEEMNTVVQGDRPAQQVRDPQAPVKERSK